MSTEFRRRTSLGLNVVLAASVVALGFYRSNRTAPLPARGSPGKTADQSQREVQNSRYTETASSLDRQRSMIDRLRALGAPNAILGLVAQADREMQWERRFERCRGNPNQLEALRLEKDMSKDADMRAALGADDFRQWDTTNMRSEAMATPVETSAAEIDAIYLSKKNLDRRLLEARTARMSGKWNEAGERAASEEAYAAFSRELEDVLGPLRYAQAQQWDDASVTANFRAMLAKAKLNPGETQFQKLFEIQRQYNEAQAQLGQQHQKRPSSIDFPAQAKALEDARDREYERVLGHDVFVRFQQAQDPGFRQMKKYEAYWGLDDSKVDDVYQAIRQYDNAVRDYIAAARSRSSNLEPAKNKLRQATAQTQQRLEHRLGQQSLDRLLRNGIVQFYHPAGDR